MKGLAGIALLLSFPFVHAACLKWFAWAAGITGVDAQALTYCCYLAGLSVAVMDAKS